MTDTTLARRALIRIGGILGLAIGGLLIALLGIDQLGPIAGGIVLGLAALAGVCASRLHWITYFAFRTKTFDPMLLMQHYAWIAVGPLIALALLALGVGLGAPLDPTAPLTLALAFTLGLFSEETWGILHGRFRALVGKPLRNDPVAPVIDGIDVPLTMLGGATQAGGQKAEAVIAALRAQGIEYSHQLLSQEKTGRLEDLAEKVKVDPKALLALAKAADAVRVGTLNDEGGVSSVQDDITRVAVKGA